MAINIREGRWGVSRIVQEADGGYAVAAMLQSPRLADVVEAYYPPLQNGASARQPLTRGCYRIG